MKIELKDLYKSYINQGGGIEQKVIKGISMILDQGEAIAIIGPSGSGKSTLLNLLGTLDTPSQGAVYLDGKDSKDFTEKELASLRNQKIGFIFQSHHLLPQLNVIENILLPTIPNGDKAYKKEAEKRAHHWLQRVGLDKDIHKFPSQLSGGECQRVAVLRALINQPEFILADEPTGSLDGDSADKIGDLLKEIHETEKVSLLVVTHSMELAEKIGKVMRLKEGVLGER